MNAILQRAIKGVTVLVWPVQYVVDTLHRGKVVNSLRSKKVAKVSIGIVIMLTGSTMAVYPVAFIPHIVWDAIAYGLHGYGALPLIKIACHHLNLEEIEEKRVRKRKARNAIAENNPHGGI